MQPEIGDIGEFLLKIGLFNIKMLSNSTLLFESAKRAAILSRPARKYEKIKQTSGKKNRMSAEFRGNDGNDAGCKND